MSDYELFLTRYANKHRITEEEAERHLMVKLVKLYYAERDKSKIENA